MDTSLRSPCVPSTVEGFRGAERIGTRGSRVVMAGPPSAAADVGTQPQARGTKDHTSQSAKIEAEAQR